MKKRIIAPAVLIVSCMLLAAVVFTRLQSRPLQPPEVQSIVPGFNGLPASPVERAEAINSVQGQLDAFRSNDYVKATYYQSPWLKVSVGSPEEFRFMMRSQYPRFTNFAHVQFGDVMAAMNGQQVVVPISLTGKDGNTVSAVYVMGRGRDGIYRVTGVTMAR